MAVFTGWSKFLEAMQHNSDLCDYELTHSKTESFNLGDIPVHSGFAHCTRPMIEVLGVTISSSSRLLSIKVNCFCFVVLFNEFQSHVMTLKQ